ncbi:MAG: hypothetical protein AAGB26_06535 [Planctomycetota bacterium]
MEYWFPNCHMKTKAFTTVLVTLILCYIPAASAGAKQWVTYPGGDGPGAGKHIVLVSGDEEYRSEEALPQLGKILSKHHGFACTVLFAINPKTGIIDPNHRSNIPGLEALKDADLMVVSLRFRDLPDEQMKHIDDYLMTGKPVIGMRTSTHAFNIGGNKTYSHYSWKHSGDANGAWEKGFGGFILGETWVAHHGIHKGEGTNGLIVQENKDHPILSGIEDGDVWGDTDVYTIDLPLPGDSKPLVMGQVVEGLKPGGKASQRTAKKTGKPVNDPMMPVAWTKSYQLPNGGKKGIVFTTTMGSSTDLNYMGTRRMLVNAAYYLTGIDVPEDGTMVDTVGEFEATMYAFKRGSHWPDKALKPSDFAMDH